MYVVQISCLQSITFNVIYKVNLKAECNLYFRIQSFAPIKQFVTVDRYVIIHKDIVFKEDMTLIYDVVYIRYFCTQRFIRDRPAILNVARAMSVPRMRIINQVEE